MWFHTSSYSTLSLPFITRRGKPAALLVGVEGKDWETIIPETDPTFWKLIQQRRKEPTISLKELKARLNRKR